MKEKLKAVVDCTTKMLWRVRYGLSGLILSMTVMTQQLCMKAAPKAKATATPANENEFDFLKNGSSNGAFDKMTSVTQQTGVSLLKFVKTFGIVSIAIATLLCAISYGFSKSPQVKEGNKSWALQILISATVVFGVFGIISLVASIGYSLN